VTTCGVSPVGAASRARQELRVLLVEHINQHHSAFSYLELRAPHVKNNKLYSCRCNRCTNRALYFKVIVYHTI